MQLYSGTSSWFGTTKIYPHTPEAFKQLECHTVIIGTEQAFKFFLQKKKK